ncbi:MAG: helix-turn-helix transcriptional regulator [Cytophagaceae bacterium]|jgi:DNA-binding HxlR family transcriptional regulator|nr:helix-turn-helix transcriptional regulator [Cytophagaceae bacterium]
MSDLRYNNKWYRSGIELFSDVLHGKWKLVILWYLYKKDARFSELRKNIPSITDRMLSLQLKELEELGFIKRVVHPGNPPKVSYEIMELGASLLPALEALDVFGRAYSKEVKAVTRDSSIVHPPEDDSSFFDEI